MLTCMFGFFALIFDVISNYLVYLGLDDTDSRKTTLEVYRQYFEQPFVNATQVYYTLESERFVSENSVTEYMKRVKKN
jgi:cullin 1